jgi:hypothetical protein
MPTDSVCSAQLPDLPGPALTPNPSFEAPMGYRGWKIYCWTGWKGYRSTKEVGKDRECPVCHLPVKVGDLAYYKQGFDEELHYKCSGDRGTIVGQWLAMKGETMADARFLVSSVPGEEREFQKGEDFDVKAKEKQEELFYDTPLVTLEAAREEGLVRMRALIAKIEGVKP